MAKFKRPKNTDNELTDEQKSDFHEEFASAAGLNKEKIIEQPVKKRKKEILTKISLNMRGGDLKRADIILNKLIDNGQRNPLPSSTDIHRMGILYLSKASDEELINLFKQILQ
jgi:hypothetical protein